MAEPRQHQYAVTGSGEFPRDMLRYDEASFATHADGLLAGTGYVSSVRTVNICSRRWPTGARWESFGWRVDHPALQVSANGRLPMADTTLAPCPTEREQFEAWWESDGQFVCAGGGDYEKSFAYAAWLRAARRAITGATNGSPE